MADAGRTVIVESLTPSSRPLCGVVAVSVHSRWQQRVCAIPVAGAMRVLWAEPRWFCEEPSYIRGTFAESTVQVPARARSTTRLKEEIAGAVTLSRRAGAEVARAFGVSSWVVNTVVLAAAAALATAKKVAPARIGIDEHRYRSVRWFKDQTRDSWCRY